jgi:undecaprenyl phosphate N,N'-diacetylbacillosamine 1-phosphate transferase
LSVLYTNKIKPLIDTFISSLILLIALPVFLAIVIVLYFVNDGHVWFTQERPGKNGEVFSVIKFKTMSDERDASGNLLPDEKRLSGVGKFIRKTSLDELPQLLNVVRGHMSLVGPRPLLTEYLPLYNDVQRRRHEVKPGITGWAQVNGRNTVSWPQKFAYDVWYVDHISFWLDIKILFLTVMKVFKAEGISSETSVTMEKFHGNN